jgi:hypothetical protein
LIAACRSTTPVKEPRRIRRRVSAEKKPSTAVSHEAEVGVKGHVQRGWRASQARTFGCLWVATLSRIAWIALPGGTAASTALRNRTNSPLRWRCMQRPSTVPAKT